MAGIDVGGGEGLVDEVESERAPEICETDIGAQRPKFYRGVERKRRAGRHEASERVTIEMVSVRRIGGPIGIRIVWRDNFYQTRRLGYAMQFADKRHYVRYVLNNVAANNLIKFIVGERIRYVAQIVDDIGVAAWI